MAEAHPVGFRWVMKAKERGATIIHVDPQIFAHERAGRYLGADSRRQRHRFSRRARQARSSRTNCSFAITSCTTPMPRAFCAKIFATRKKARPAFSPAGTRRSALTIRRAGYYAGDGLSFPERDLTLQNPRCVFQTLSRHFARYTPEMVEKICGIPPALFHKVADALVGASGPEKPPRFVMRSVGRNIRRAFRSFAPRRSCNYCSVTSVGRAVESSRCAVTHQFRARPIFRRSTIFCLVTFRCRAAVDGEDTLQDYLANQTKPTGLWRNTPAYFISLAQGLLRQERDAGKRFRLRLAPENHRRTIPSSNTSITWPTAKWKACS